MTFHLLTSCTELPERMNNPFGYEPHPLCLAAAAEVQAYIAAHDDIRRDADQGKMFGVLVVATDGGEVGFLAAYSGLLAGRNDWSYFVPPVYDAQQPDGHFKQEERAISLLNEQLRQPSLTDSQVQALRRERRARSEALQLWLFRQYRVRNARGEEKDLVQLWTDYHTERVRRRFPLPPGGTGDCCAPKLLQWAYLSGLRPLQMAEFWWGQSPRTEIRHHLCYYPACRGKCLPLLTFMLQGLDVDGEQAALPTPDANATIEVCYEDESLLVVNKPSGLLSVPGRRRLPSVVDVLRRQGYDGYLEPVHRLDMGTSGLLVVARSADVYRALQRQFASHDVQKRYVALIDGRPAHQQGTISLPLQPNPLDRPRQMVGGREAVTDYVLVADGRLHLWPRTGRTHQLRFHCAHPDGLGCPIRGDELYGTPSTRLYLHAEELTFRHPLTAEPLHFSCFADF